MSLGRPKAELDLPDGWNDEVIGLYSKGASDVEIKALIYEWRGSLSNDLWDRWLKEEEFFSETIKRGRALSEAWWQEQGRVNLKETQFSPTLWYMNMRNRFNWADKKEIKVSDLNISVTLDGEDEESED